MKQGATTTESVVLRASQLAVRYHNGALGITDVSLSVGVGQVVALFGPNGAGKTTTVRAITGFLRSEGARITSGSVHILGVDVTNMEPHRTSALGVAVVPEREKIFANLTVSDNLEALGRLPPRDRRSEVFDSVYELFPVLARRRKQLAGRLSGGEQQMLAIGRALILEPRLLIIDELTLGLHHSLHGVLYDAVQAIARTGTALMIVDESTGFALEVASHCFLLRAGRVSDEGPAEKFIGSELLAAGYVEASS